MEKSKLIFEVGDKVTWSSQASGSVYTRYGKIVAVVPPGIFPGLVFNRLPDREQYCKLDMKEGRLRDQRSYIVVVEQPGNKKAKPYWPLVTNLLPVDEETP